MVSNKVKISKINELVYGQMVSYEHYVECTELYTVTVLKFWNVVFV